MTRTLAVVVCAACAACSAGPAGPGVSVDRVLEHVRVLSADIGPRPGGTEAATRAAAYIETSLVTVGATPERRAVGVVDVPAIDVGPLRIRPASHRDCVDDNIIARFGPAVSGALVLIAHYDTVVGAPGAFDNGAAVAVLLELARELAAHPPATPVWLAFTADEEVGLIGARKLADELGDGIGFAISLDGVGVEGDLIVNGASELIRGAELRWLAGAATAAGVDLAAPWPHRIVSRWWPQVERSDHGPFTMRGIRAVHLFSRGGTPGERIYLAYHRPGDRIEGLSRTALDDVGRLVRALAAQPPPAPSAGDLGVWLPVPGNHVIPRWSLVVVCGLLLGTAVLGLLSIRRHRTPGPGLFAASAVWLIAGAITVGIELLTWGEYPAPWIHAPLRHEIAVGLVLAGVAALATVMIARWRPWAGPHRYAVAAAVWNLVIGAALVVLQAAELAWWWLVPAALLAWAPRLGDRGHRVLAVIVVVLAIVPVIPLVSPGLLRELYFHGFLPHGTPLTALLAMHGLTAGLAIAHLAARVRIWGPGATFAVPTLAVLAIAVGTLTMVTYEPPCDAGDLMVTRLGCELRR